MACLLQPVDHTSAVPVRQSSLLPVLWTPVWHSCACGASMSGSGACVSGVIRVSRQRLVAGRGQCTVGAVPRPAPVVAVKPDTAGPGPGSAGGAPGPLPGADGGRAHEARRAVAAEPTVPGLHLEPNCLAVRTLMACCLCVHRRPQPLRISTSHASHVCASCFLGLCDLCKQRAGRSATARQSGGNP